MTASTDGELHLLRMMILDEQVRQGVLFPRWIPELYTGLGYPLFNYYAPLSYYLGVLFHGFGLSYAASFVAALCALILIGGLGMYRLAGDVFGERFRGAALVAAVAYMYTPYLLTNVYVRGAIAEVAAQALLPWIFWSVRRLLTSQEPLDYLVPAVLSLGAMALTHNITLILLPPAVVGYALVLWWQEGRKRKQLVWAALALLMAAGVSAFFWLPVAAERSFILRTPFLIARDIFVPENVWRWDSFLDPHLAFEYTFAIPIPFQLGLVQVGLSVAGLAVARRRDPEWLYLLAVAIIGCLFIGAWSLPLWLSNDLLLTVQFPWRLLSIVSVPLALFIGGTASRSQPMGRQMAISTGVILIVILANFPRTTWMEQMKLPDDPAPAALAGYEAFTRALGTTFMKEFRPRWALEETLAATSSNAAYDQVTVVNLEAANRYGLQATIDSPAGGSVHFGSLYFPGWRTTANDAELQPYPSTGLGLLTVDVPPGSQELRVEWRGTSVQAVGALVSLLALLGLSILVGWRARRRWLAVFPAGLLALGIFMAWWRPPLAEVQFPQVPVESADLSLLGYQLKRIDAQHLIVYPYWYVRQTPPTATRIRWQVRDEDGEVVAEQVARSYFNSYPFGNWPSGTVVDDAYLLSLPPGLPAATYDITLQILPGADSAEAQATILTSVDLETPPVDQPDHAADVRFGAGMSLIGYDVYLNSSLVPAGEVPVASPGDTVAYELYWQATEPLQQDYHAFVHLVDSQRRLLVQDDQLAGSAYSPPSYWATLDTQRDRYVLQIPWDTGNEVLWPIVGAYEADTMEHLPVHAEEGTKLGDSYRLPAIKVLSNPSGPEPEFAIEARLGPEIGLSGYDLDLPQAEIRPGDSLTVTLHFESQVPTNRDLIRFVHLYDPELGMAAQMDSQPGDGSNPTWAWVPGETIVDRVVLTVSDHAAPGKYWLLTGFYDRSDGTRLPFTDQAGTLLPDGLVRLTEVEVER